MKEDTIFINRELSWLDFNRRVLVLGKDKNVPLAEQVKFLAIYGSNLDEFFMVRVGSLVDQMLLKKDIRDNKTNLTPEEQIKKILAEVGKLNRRRNVVYDEIMEELEEYDYIIIDTAPALGVVLYNSLIAADRVIIPITADAYSLQGINQLYSTIKAVQKRQNPSLKIEGLLLVKYSGRSNLEKNMLDELKKTADSMGTKLFETKIRECVKTKEAQSANKLLIDYAPNCTTMQDYNELVKELM